MHHAEYGAFSLAGAAGKHVTSSFSRNKFLRELLVTEPRLRRTVLTPTRKPIKKAHIGELFLLAGDEVR
jgi:hypothetical protein